MRFSIGLMALALLPGAAWGQTAGQVAEQEESPIVGTWRLDAKQDARSGPREVVIRSDSSATWGKETSRWRLNGERISIAIGGEWEIYDVKVEKTELTLSGGDLQKPITLKKIGPATPRAPGVKLPEDPDSGE